jgi:predicted dehydrogenase
MLNIGIIGVGYLGSHHARVLSEMEDVVLIGVADVVKERAESIASRYGCRPFRDFRELLPLADALIIATPTKTHYEIALQCLRENKDILVEKPFTSTLEEADHLIEEGLKRERIIQVGHLERFNTAVTEAERFIDKPSFFESTRVSPFITRGTDVDITLDLMIHDIDIILTLTQSKVKEIYATGAKVLTDTLDVAKAWLQMEDGTQALITASRLSEEKKRILRIFQNSAMIQIDYQKTEITIYSKNSRGIIEKEIIIPSYREPLREELLDFINSTKERKTPKVNAIQGREALRVALEISRRITNG